MARMHDPRNGFDPFRIDGRIDVVWVGNPADLGIPGMEHVWRDAVGCVLARPTDPNETEVLYMNVINSLVKNPWSHLEDGAWHCLGGNMLKGTGTTAIEGGLKMVGSSWEEGARNTAMKASAMAPKWFEVDKGFEGIGHPFRFMMGGGKSQTWYRYNNRFLRLAGLETASLVSNIIGAHIGGSDEGMSKEFCSLWSLFGPKNFMGAVPHKTPEYAGEGDPSPHTARGVFEAMKVYYRENHGGYVPTLVQGYGNVGRPLVGMLVRERVPISGIMEVDLEALKMAREELGRGVRLLWDRSTTPPDRLEELTEKAKAIGAEPVDGLVGALEATKDTTEFLSPNAIGHPLTPKVVRWLISKESKVKTIVGAANNLHDIVGNSNSILVWLLYNHGISVGYDNGTNFLGASSTGWGVARLEDLHKQALYAQAGRNAELFIRESRMRKLPAQLVGEARGYAGMAALRADDLSIGGDIAPESIVARPPDAVFAGFLAGTI